MTTAIVLDPKGGFSFKGKRIAQDRIVRKRILGLAPVIYMSEYTASQYREVDKEHIAISEKAPNDENAVYYLEVGHIPADTDTLLVYRLDVRYPADMKIIPTQKEWELISTETFAGHSHKTITLEKYRKLS